MRRAWVEHEKSRTAVYLVADEKCEVGFEQV